MTIFSVASEYIGEILQNHSGHTLLENCAHIGIVPLTAQRIQSKFFNGVWTSFINPNRLFTACAAPQSAGYPA